MTRMADNDATGTRAAGTWLCADCGYPTPYKDTRGDGDPVCAFCFLHRHPKMDFKLVEVILPRDQRHA